MLNESALLRGPTPSFGQDSAGWVLRTGCLVGAERHRRVSPFAPVMAPLEEWIGSASGRWNYDGKIKAPPSAEAQMVV